MKKFTLLFLMLFGAIGFAQQTTLKGSAVDNPTHHNPYQKARIGVLTESQQAAEANMKNLGENKPFFITEKAGALNESQRAADAIMTGLGENKPVFNNNPQSVRQTRNEFPFMVSATNSGVENSQAEKQNVINNRPTTATVNYEMPLGAKSFSSFEAVNGTRTIMLSQRTSSVVTGQRKPSAVTPYTDRAAFEAAYSGTLINEDFAGGPGAGQISACGPIVSSAGDGCFPAGELEEGFNITASSGGDVIYLGAGAIGNTSTSCTASINRSAPTA